MKHRLAWLGAALFGLAAGILLGATWWWALLGMSSEIGQAWLATGFLAILGAIAALGIRSEL